MQLDNNFIDLFAGCGGLSLGLMRAGWRGLFAVEKSADAFQTFKENLVDSNGRSSRFCFDWPNGIPQTEMAIEEVLVNYSSYLEYLGNVEGAVGLIAGGPPCQGFSHAGRRNNKDPRNYLIEHYIDFVNLVRPRFLLIENVHGIATMAKRGDCHATGKGESYANYIERRLREIDYHVEHDTLRACDYGVPQLRPRRIFVGVNTRVCEVSEGFSPFIMKDWTRVRFLKKRKLGKIISDGKYITVKEAIGDLTIKKAKERVNGGTVACEDSKGFERIDYKRGQGKPSGYQRLVGSAKNGRNLFMDTPNSLRLARHREDTVRRFKSIIKYCNQRGRKGISLSVEERRMFGMRKHSLVVLNEHAPSHTLTTLPDDMLHFAEPRILTVREYARLQSFPDWYSFKGKYTTGGKRRLHECPRYTQVGNAVPPLLAEFLGSLLKDIDKKILRK